MTNSDGSNTQFSDAAAASGWEGQPGTAGIAQSVEPNTLKNEVEKSLKRYFRQIEDEQVTDLYQLVLSEVEAPLLQSVMRYTGNNQSKAAIMLGLTRGTLRSKLKQYGLLD